MVHKLAAIAAGLLCATVMIPGNAFLNQANTGLEVLPGRILEAREDNLDAINLLSRNNEPESIGCLNGISNQLVELGCRRIRDGHIRAVGGGFHRKIQNRRSVITRRRSVRHSNHSGRFGSADCAEYFPELSEIFRSNGFGLEPTPSSGEREDG